MKNYCFYIFTLCILILPNFSCNSLQKRTVKSVNNKNIISVELRSASKDSLNNMPATVTIYGYDMLMADVDATVIAQKEIQVSSFPFQFNMEIPTNPELLIQPTISAKENAKYYLSIANSNTNKYSIELDYNKGFPYVNLLSDKMQIFYVIKEW